MIGIRGKPAAATSSRIMEDGARHLKFGNPMAEDAGARRPSEDDSNGQEGSGVPHPLTKGVSVVDVSNRVLFARGRLIYGKEGKVIPESMEDEADMMTDGADLDGGDGGFGDDTISHQDGTNRQEQREVGEEILLAEMQKNKMISPSGAFRSRWDLVQAVLLIYIAINVPYRIGFDQGTQPWEFYFVFDAMVDIFFWVDLFLNFRTAVYTADGEIEISPKRVRKLYLKGWFPIDFVSCLPFAYIEYMVPDNTEAQDGRENRLVRLLRLMRLLKLMRLVRFKRILDRWEEELYSSGAIKFGKLLITIFGAAHWVACGWYYCGSGDDGDLVQGPNDADPGAPVRGWVDMQFEGPANSTSMTYRYVISYYWALMNIMTVDSNDGGTIYPRTVAERVMSSISMLVGGFTFGMIVGSLSDMVRRSNPGDSAKSKQLGFVHAFLHERKVPPMLTRKIRGYFAALYSQHGTVSDEMKIMNSLPQDMREELCLHLNYVDNGAKSTKRSMLWKVAFFEQLGHSDMIRISTQLKYQRIQPPEFDEAGRPDPSHYIMKQGEFTNDMFVVLEGMVRIERNNQPLGKLRAHDYFGEMGVLLESRPGYPLPRLRSAYALTPNTFMAILTFEDLLVLRHESPAIDHAVEIFAKRAAAKHPSLHPTLPEIEGHDEDDLLPPPTLAARSSNAALASRGSTRGRGGGDGVRNVRDDGDEPGAAGRVQALLQTLSVRWEAEQKSLNARMKAVETGQVATQELLASIEKKLQAA